MRTIYTWCRKQKADFIFLQETHSKHATERQWKRSDDMCLFKYELKVSAIMCSKGISSQVSTECQHRCQLSIDGVLIEVIDRHSTADAFSAHDPSLFQPVIILFLFE